MKEFFSELESGGAQDQKPRELYLKEFDRSHLVQSFIHVVRQLVLHPARFYAEVPRQGSILNPLLFAIICSEISTVLDVFLIGIGYGNNAQFEQLFKLLRLSGIPRNLDYAGLLIMSPIVSIIFIFVASSLLQLLINLVIYKQNSGFKSTIRIVSYGTVVNLISWTPIDSNFLSLYILYLNSIGIREMHKTTTGRAVLVVVTGFVTTILLLLLFLMLR